MLRPVPAEVPSCRNPGSLPSRLPGQPGRSAAAHRAGNTAAPCPVTARPALAAPRPRPLIRSITVVPPAPARIPTSSQTRRASARPNPRSGLLGIDAGAQAAQTRELPGRGDQPSAVAGHPCVGAATETEAPLAVPSRAHPDQLYMCGRDCLPTTASKHA